MAVLKLLAYGVLIFAVLADLGIPEVYRVPLGLVLLLVLLWVDETA